MEAFQLIEGTNENFHGLYSSYDEIITDHSVDVEQDSVDELDGISFFGFVLCMTLIIIWLNSFV